MTEDKILVAEEAQSINAGFKEQSEAPPAVEPDMVQTNDLVTSIIHTTFLSPTQCQAITDACESPLWIQGEIDSGQINKKLRNKVIQNFL